MIVVDASLVVELALATPLGCSIERQLDAAGRQLAAPEILDLEVLQALRRFLRLKVINETHAIKALRVFEASPIERHSHRLLRPRVWMLRDNLTAYDAAYFALAEILDAPLWTRDAKFIAATGNSPRVKML